MEVSPLEAGEFWTPKHAYIYTHLKNNVRKLNAHNSAAVHRILLIHAISRGYTMAWLWARKVFKQEPKMTKNKKVQQKIRITKKSKTSWTKEGSQTNKKQKTRFQKQMHSKKSKRIINKPKTKHKRKSKDKDTKNTTQEEHQTNCSASVAGAAGVVLVGRCVVHFYVCICMYM